MTRIADLQDRLRRLAKRREDEGIYTDAAICEEAAESLSRTGAVKVGGLVEFAKEMCRIGFDGGSIDGCDILDTAVEHGLCKVVQYSKEMTGIAHSEYFEEGDAVYVFTDALSALEPAAPEGQQEPVERTDHSTDSSSENAIQPQPEQAVTEAMVEAYDRAYSKASNGVSWWQVGSNHKEAINAALKAAMEAGRHD